VPPAPAHGDLVSGIPLPVEHAEAADALTPEPRIII